MTLISMGYEVAGAATKAGASAHAEGRTTLAAGFAAHAEGVNSVASGYGAHTEGLTTTASATGTHAEGNQTNASAVYSHAGGYYAQANAHGQWTRGSVLSLINATRAQVSMYTMGAFTTTNTFTPLTFDANVVVATSGANTNVLMLVAPSVYHINASIVGRRANVSTASAGWHYSGLVACDNAGTPRIVGSPTLLASWGDATIGSVGFNTSSSGYFYLSVQAATAASCFWHAVCTVNELTTVS